MATKRKRKLQRAARAAARRRAADTPPGDSSARTFHKTKGGPEMEARQYAAVSASYNRRRR